MGVRFECPAGHKLHVKAELAGKRGICPECGAKFIVPSFSGQRVPEDNGVAATTTAATPPPLRQSTPPGTSVEAAAWYIRPASGGQFGPANDEVFAQWVAEGRVSADSWVWRSGWADWQSGSEALREFGARPPVPAPMSAPDFDLEEEDDASLASSAAGINLAPAPTIAAIQAAHQVEASSADLRRAEMQRRKQQVRTFSIVLGVIALAMLIALAFVLTRSSETPPTEDAAPPAAASPADAPAPATAEPTEPAEPAAVSYARRHPVQLTSASPLGRANEDTESIGFAEDSRRAPHGPFGAVAEL